MTRNASQIRDSACDPRPGDYATYADAQQASAALLNHIIRTGLEEPPQHTRRLSFEEQLALVASGKARCIEWNISKPAPDRTLGGVSEIT